MTFIGSIAASLVVLSSAMGSYREKIDRHDKEIPELRAQIQNNGLTLASHSAVLTSLDQKLDQVLANQRQIDDRLNRALDRSERR